MSRGLETQRKYLSDDLIGRFKVAYAIMMENPRLKVEFMPLECKYDLEVTDPKDKERKWYIEVKDRHNTEDKYDTAYLNIPKYKDAEPIKDKWYFVNVYTDGKIDFWKPYEMPETGITREVKMIAKSTVEKTEKIPQERLCLNFNDKCKQLENRLRITVKDDNDDGNG